jgi:serine/threonine protein phosphatase PrpC
MTMTWRTGTSTHIGGRSTNEDAVLIGDDLFAVADGIGGLPNGDEASRLALATLEAAFATNATVSGLLAACREANLAIWEWAAAQRDDVSMGTTVVALARTDDVGPVVVHAGDSRLYRIRQGHWEQLTGDHTITADLVRTGELAPDQSDGHPYQHVLTRALGVGPDVDIDLSGVSCRAGDRLVLCTDGLFKALSSDELAAGIPPGATPQQAADQLVEVAVANGAEDNVTVLVIDVG